VPFSFSFFQRDTSVSLFCLPPTFVPTTLFTTPLDFLPLPLMIEELFEDRTRFVCSPPLFFPCDSPDCNRTPVHGLPLSFGGGTESPWEPPFQHYSPKSGIVEASPFVPPEPVHFWFLQFLPLDLAPPLRPLPLLCVNGVGDSYSEIPTSLQFCPTVSTLRELLWRKVHFFALAPTNLTKPPRAFSPASVFSHLPSGPCWALHPPPLGGLLVTPLFSPGFRSRIPPRLLDLDTSPSVRPLHLPQFVFWEGGWRVGPSLSLPSHFSFLGPSTTHFFSQTHEFPLYPPTLRVFYLTPGKFPNPFLSVVPGKVSAPLPF